MAINSAKDHLIASQLLANKGFYGMAISHCILGAEEAVKCLYLQIKLNEKVVLTDKEYEKVFSSHLFKHKEILNNYVNFLALSKASKLFVEAKTDIGIHNRLMFRAGISGADSKQMSRKNLDKKLEVVIRSMIDEERQRLERSGESKVLIKWISDANRLKQRGFYVDRGPVSYTSPREFSQDLYEHSHQLSSSFISNVEEVMINDDWHVNKTDNGE